ncbi:MAG: hypothetical protein RMI94_05310 [Bryobacterales bacterium]|nr:hypothetical protein [Bryobacteraceae bacterium]MDW8129947.1 hypothetical protein [Bryobacterales bacterium]
MRALGPVCALLVVIPTCGAAQPGAIVCKTSGAPLEIRWEGLSEAVGDIVFHCAGGSPWAQITTNLVVLAPVNVTNRLTGTGTVDVRVEADNGGGFAPLNVPATYTPPATVAFHGLSFQLSASGTVALRITNLRLAVNQLPASLVGQPLRVFLGSSGQNAMALDNPQVIVGIPYRGLLAAASATRILCTGSRLPEAPTFTNLMAAGTRFASMRLTEGFASAFRARRTGEDTGTRFLIRYAGFPPGARLFVPDVIAGSSAVEPTAAGDLGWSVSGGKYASLTGGSLLLARVAGADPGGVGGVPVYAPGPVGSGTVSFDAVSEVSLAGGSGYVVYEVMDASPTMRESAQLPTFVGLAPPAGSEPVVASWTVTLAPLSALASASSTAAVPRFAPVAPGQDCEALGDCHAPYFPRLFVEAIPPLEYTGVSGGGHQVGYVRIANEGGGLLVWRVTITYQDGSGWLRVDRTEGVGNATLRVDALPASLAPGTYRATLTVDAGPPAGSRSLPVVLKVSAPPPVVERPVIGALVNAATFREGPVAPGSLASLFGSRLTGTQVSAAFDGIAARLLYTSATQINLRVPPELDGRSHAQLVVTVDGIASAPYSVALAAAAPGIFGILNENNTLNGPSAPALPGSTVQIFATGLPEEGRTAIVRIHDRTVSAPSYAGPAPGLIGVQQINAIVPADLPAMTTEVRVCAAGVCSPPAPLVLAR